MKRWIAILMLLVLLLSLFACAEEDYVVPTAVWCSSMHNLVGRAVGDTFEGDVISLQKFSEATKPEITRFDGVAGEFLHYAMQLADLMQGYDSFYDVPHFEQQAILEAWYILANANHAESEEEYSKIIEGYARTWLDAYISGSSGKTLPLTPKE